MNFVEKIEINKKEVVAVLYEWAHTFDLERDDEDEPSLEIRDYIFDLAERLENGECNEQDYEEILFHIEQINHDEIKIDL